MTETILQVRLLEPRCFAAQDIETPTPGPGEVSIRVQNVGICGSDIHAYHGEHPFIHCPVTLGHEFSGRVAACGPGVTGCVPGQRVTVEPLLTCGHCRMCRTGRYNCCRDIRVIGCQSSGAFAEIVLVPVDRVVPVPDSLSFEQAALLEPSAVACHAVSRSRIVPGEKMLVLGAGPIGLLYFQVAKANGVGEIIVADYIADRLALAKAMGADHVALLSEKAIDAWVGEYFGDDGADVIVDCVGGHGEALNTAVDLARRGTRIVAVGIFSANIMVRNMAFLPEHELDILSTFTYLKQDFLDAIRLMDAGMLSTDGLVSHRFPLSRVQDAFEEIEKGRNGFTKIMLSVP